ncbi:MAG: RNA polymerase sigma factor [bacterium]|nr:RNA polymerase sigma factor [bacterium]
MSSQDLIEPITPEQGERPVRVVRGDEGRLLLRHREGDREAFATLVSEYRAPVYSYLSRCGVDPADRDDLFQEVFIKIHRAAGSYQADRPAHPWIFTIVSNTIRSHLRKRRVRQLIFAEPATEQEPTDSAPDGERRAAARETAAFVHDEIGKLRLVQREVVLLACVERMPLKEVGEVLRVPVNTVKTHLRRARLALAGALARRRGEVTT